MKNFLSNIGTSLSNFGNRALLKAKKASPEILLISGIVGFGATIVLACRATVKSEEVLDRHKAMMDRAKEAEAVAVPEDNFDISREKFAIFKCTVLDMAKLYALPTAVGGLSLAFILKSNNILKGRYLGAVEAFNAVSGAFNAYRDRVREELGDEMDRHFRYGTEKRIETVKKVDENGNEIEEEKTNYVTDIDVNGDEFTRLFDESNKEFYNNPTLNLMFLKGQITRANDYLRARGHLFYNELLYLLGFEHTPVGAVTGWIMDGGKGFIDCSILHMTDENVHDYINGKDSTILLEFYVDGVIYDKIGPKAGKNKVKLVTVNENS